LVQIAGIAGITLGVAVIVNLAPVPELVLRVGHAPPIPAI